MPIASSSVRVNKKLYLEKPKRWFHTHKKKQQQTNWKVVVLLRQMISLLRHRIWMDSEPIISVRISVKMPSGIIPLCICVSKSVVDFTLNEKKLNLSIWLANWIPWETYLKATSLNAFIFTLCKWALKWLNSFDQLWMVQIVSRRNVVKLRLSDLY